MPDAPHPIETVSVVIPTRNRALMAVAAVRSALAQTYPPLEILVVIDGPEEQLGRTAEALAAIADPRLRVLALPASVGGGEARNLGVRGASGDWIAFLDDDDLWLRHKLEIQLAYARNLAEAPDQTRSRATEAQQRSATSASLTRTAQSVFDEHKSRPTRAPQQPATSPEPTRTARRAVLSCLVVARSPHWEEVWPREPYRTGQPMSEYLFCRRGWRYGSALLQTSTLLVPRELLIQVPFTPGLVKHQDWDWLLRAAAEPGVQVHSVGSEPLAVFHVEGERSSVGRARNWRFSLAWARERRVLFTRRALAGFLATECAAQATDAPWRERAALLWAFFRTGIPRLIPFLQLGVFLFVSQSLRRRVRDSLRRLARPTNSQTAVAASPRDL